MYNSKDSFNAVIEKEDTFIGILDEKVLKELKKLDLELNHGIKTRPIPFRLVYHRFGVIFRMNRYESFQFLKELQSKGLLKIISSKGVIFLDITECTEQKKR